VNVFVCFELQKIEPDLNKIAVWMQRYFYAVALQGMMQGGEAVTVMGFLLLGASFRARFKYPYIVIHRIDLHNVMLNACRRDPLISLVQLEKRLMTGHLAGNACGDPAI